MLKTTIPFVDLRGKTPIDLLRAYPDKAHALLNASRRVYGTPSYIASIPAMRLGDKRSHKWLKRTKNPYLYEIESYAEIMGVPGLFMLNVIYEWACTSGAYAQDEGVSMLRVLDWPFPLLGKHVMVLLQQSAQGDYYNISWPGISGVYTAMAPGRFAAAINQAPMRRHNNHYAIEWYKNRRLTHKEEGLPPSHLLRKVFEQATDYETAKLILSEMPIAIPAIFTLTGTKPGQGCVIERLEHTAEIRELSAGQQVTTSNHFITSLNDVGAGWRPREADSTGRFRQSCSYHGHDLQHPDFNWLQAPIINHNTRLCVVTDALTGRLQVQGFEGMTQVTEIFHLPQEAHVRKQAV